MFAVALVRLQDAAARVWYPGRYGALPAPLRSFARLGAARGRAVRTALAAWAEAERGRFALWLPLFMAAGAAWYLLARAEPPAWSGAAASVGATAARLLLGRWPLCRHAATAALAASLGVLSGQAATWRATPPLDVPNRAVVVTGTVAAVELLPEARRVTLRGATLASAAGQSPASARAIRVRLRATDTAPVETGDTLRVRALLSRPSAPAYPGAWDLQRVAFFNGAGAYGFALGAAAVTHPASRPLLSRMLQRTREAIAARVTASVPPDRAAIAVTLLTGDAAAVSADDKAAFRDSGLAHLLAIAGLHIGIVMGLVFAATRFLLACSERAALHWPLKAIAALAALAAGGLYMALTGAHVPILRSFGMASMFTLAVLSGRRALSRRGWALAMAALVLIEPDEVLGVSFQMSFSAVLALIAGFEALRPWLQRLGGARKLLAYVAGLALTSALAGSASAPFAAYHFGRVQLHFVLANLVAVPLTALFVMPLGLLALLLMPFGIERLALLPMGWGELAILWVGRHVAALPASVLAVPSMPAWGIVLVALGLCWLGLWATRLRGLGALAVAAGLVSPLLARPPDLLVSADARLIALRTPDGAFAEAGRGADRFTRDAFAQYWAVPSLADLPDAWPDTPGGGHAPALACDEAACRWRAAAGSVALIARTPPGPEACAAAVVVSAAPLRLRCPGRVAMIDRFSVWREGAHAIWLAPGSVRVLSEQAVRGVRPWTPPPHHARATAGLPLAALDTGTD